MLQRDKLREADLITSMVLGCLSIAVIVGACRMPMGGTYGGMPITWYTSPGFFPLSLGALLMLGAASVFARSWRDGAQRRIGQRLKAIVETLPRNLVVRRMVVVWFLLVAYVLGLALHVFAGLGALFEPIANSSWTAVLAQPEGANYIFCSFVFLGSFMYLFYYRPRARQSWTHLALLPAFCLLMAWGVGYVFVQHLYSPLPW